jgi:hypothetical protein
LLAHGPLLLAMLLTLFIVAKFPRARPFIGGALLMPTAGFTASAIYLVNTSLLVTGGRGPQPWVLPVTALILVVGLVLTLFVLARVAWYDYPRQPNAGGRR